jgi:hypothetical protein
MNMEHIWRKVGLDNPKPGIRTLEFSGLPGEREQPAVATKLWIVSHKI